MVLVAVAVVVVVALVVVVVEPECGKDTYFGAPSIEMQRNHAVKTPQFATVFMCHVVT